MKAEQSEPEALERKMGALFAETREEPGRAALARLEARAVTLVEGGRRGPLAAVARRWRWALGGALVAGGAAAAVALASAGAPDEVRPAPIPVAGGNLAVRHEAPVDPPTPVRSPEAPRADQPWSLDDTELAMDAGWDEEDELGLDAVPDVDGDDPDDLDGMQAGFEAVLGT